MQTIEVRVPDIGDFKDIPIIELLVEPGDVIQPGDPLLTLESDKATLDVPAPLGGRVASVAVAPGNKVSHGSLILRLISAEMSEAQAADVPTVPDVAEMTLAPSAAISQPSATASLPRTASPRETHSGRVYAGPAIRLLARSLGVDLANVVGSGRRGRLRFWAPGRRLSAHSGTDSSSSRGSYSRYPSVGIIVRWTVQRPRVSSCTSSSFFRISVESCSELLCPGT